MKSEAESVDKTSRVIELLATIRAKSDRALWEDTRGAAGNEKKAQALLIAHLAEVRLRRLYLDKGLGTMFAYCQQLGFAENEIWLRLQVSSCCLKIPELLEELAANSISLTVAGKVCAHLNESNKESILAFPRFLAAKACAARLHTSSTNCSAVSRTRILRRSKSGLSPGERE